MDNDTNKFKDPYQILGLDPKKKPSDQDIKHAFRERAKRYHPDYDKEGQYKKQFEEISWAYDILGDTRKRERYDRFGFLEPDMNELKQGVQSTIRAYLSQMIDKGDEIFGIDVINQLAGYCKAQILVAKKQIALSKKRQSHLKKVMSKFKKKQQLSYDFVTNYFLEELNALYQNINTNMTTIRILEETIIVVKSYEFEVDPTIVRNKIVPDSKPEGPPNEAFKESALGNIFDHAAKAR